MAWGEMGVRSVLRGSGDLALTGIDDLAWRGGAGGPVLYASSGAGGALSAWSLDGQGGLAPIDRVVLPTAATAGIGGGVLLLEGARALVATTGVGGPGLMAFAIEDGGALGARAAIGSPGAGLPADLHDALLVATGSGAILYGLRLGSDRVSAWAMGADGALRALSVPAPSSPAAAGLGLADLAAVTRDGATFLVGASSQGDALVCWRVAPNGVPVESGRIGAAQGLGIDAPAALATATLGERAYVVMASSGSGTLTVAEVRSDGSLLVTDHLLDDLGTRFAGAGVVSTCSWQGRVFVAAAGGDDGLSLFELLPGGRLLLLSTLADTTATTLSGVTALALAVGDGALQVAVASGSEPGVTLLSVPLPAAGVAGTGTTGDDSLAGGDGADRLDGGPGADVVSGGAGDDVLMDGTGADRLSGGAGEDVFVLAADGEADVIADFRPGEDRIDLSGWAGLRSPAQLLVRATVDGAVISFGGETLRIVTASGRPLSAVEMQALDLLGVTRMLPPPSAMTSPRTLTGGAGDDTLTGAANADSLSGRGGDDVLGGRGGADRIQGGSGSDRIFGGDGADTVWGGDGDDALLLGNGFDRAHGEDGDDSMRGRWDGDMLWGGGGDDGLWGGSGADRLVGDGGRDRLDGGGDGDLLWGGAGDDWLAEGGSPGSLWGGSGDDTLLGDAGADRLWGEDGNDALKGGQGDDALDGATGLDRLWGGDGDDRLSGGDGDDRLDGGAGQDRLVGGRGADRFVFSGGQDRVGDFQDGVDTIVLDDALWGGGARTPAQMLGYATVVAGALVFAFPGGDTLVVENVGDPRLLLDDLALG